jgi:hypothetical protein
LLHTSSVNRSGNCQVIVPIDDRFETGAFAAFLKEFDAVFAFGHPDSYRRSGQAL